MLFWVDKNMDWVSPASDKRGRARKFSDATIHFYLMVKNLFWLALRQVTGLAEKIIEVILPGLADAILLNAVL